MPYFPSPRETLDDEKKRTIVALVSGGNSQRCAARFVGCAPSTITRAAARDADFDAALARARQTAELKLLRRIQDAGKNPQHWRASAWLLERLNPDDYTVHPDVVTREQLKLFIAELCEQLCKNVPLENMERAIRKLEYLLYEQGLLRPLKLGDNRDSEPTAGLPKVEDAAETSADETEIAWDEPVRHTAPLSNETENCLAEPDFDFTQNASATPTTNGRCVAGQNEKLEPSMPQQLPPT